MFQGVFSKEGPRSGAVEGDGVSSHQHAIPDAFHGYFDVLPSLRSHRQRRFRSNGRRRSRRRSVGLGCRGLGGERADCGVEQCLQRSDLGVLSLNPSMKRLNIDPVGERDRPRSCKLVRGVKRGNASTRGKKSRDEFIDSGSSRHRPRFFPPPTKARARA